MAPRSTPSNFDPRDADATLFAALLGARRRAGGRRIILEDIERAPLSYDRLVVGALVMGAKLAALTRRREAVGVLLPNVNGLVVTLFGLNAFGRVATLLNFTAGLKSLKAAVRTAQVSLIVTSRRFVETAKLEAEVAALAAGDGAQQGVRIIYLEDVRRNVGIADKITGVARAAFARAFHARHALAPNEPAVVLFTSGTEGLPKGVVLSNRNLLANALQISAHARDALHGDDVVMNPLPMFHSFGLTAACLMPVLRGMKTVLYPSPLHYKQVPALIAATQCSVLFATDTFLQGYARAAGEQELASVRVVVCGAERVKDTTRQLWAKWKTQILEGYGVTECSPVIACNLPHNNLSGTVGTLLPGIEVKLEPVAGIPDGGRLNVRGPNVMSGYMRPEHPGVLEPPLGGWHDTGDIVALDHEGRITIKGRAKRFAKIGGEMVSLAAVESMIAGLWPESNHVVVALPDPRKGEQLVLVTDKADADKTVLIEQWRAEGVSELWLPKVLVVVPAIPVLGSGKVDLGAALELAQRHRSQA